MTTSMRSPLSGSMISKLIGVAAETYLDGWAPILATDGEAPVEEMARLWAGSLLYTVDDHVLVVGFGQEIIKKDSQGRPRLVVRDLLKPSKFLLEGKALAAKVTHILRGVLYESRDSDVCGTNASDLLDRSGVPLKIFIESVPSSQANRSFGLSAGPDAVW
mmetsp:Transcript_32156/g.84291  ORF Transcript_32156/g.84291 Transcript_32156/m.84291 type:complete len:161 (-) Transcript_32156:175-657(-)